MKAVIVAAGVGKRIASVTRGKPKCLLEVGGISLLDRVIFQLQVSGIKVIGVVVGYKKELIINTLSKNITIIENDSFATTNNMTSLLYAREFVRNESFLYLHSDLIMDDDIFKRITGRLEDIIMAVDRKPCDEEAMKVRIQNDRVIESSKEIPLRESAGEWIGMIKFSPKGGSAFFEEAQKLYDQGFVDAYDTLALTRLAKGGFAIDYADVSGLSWAEIDFKEDYEKAKKLFAQ